MPRGGGRRGAARPARPRGGGAAGRLDAMEELRRRIDGIDRRLVRLLNDRAGCAIALGRIKRRRGLTIYQPAREEEVLGNIQRSNAGPLESAALRRLFERIIDESRWIERNATDRSGAPGAPRGPMSGPARTDDAQD